MIEASCFFRRGGSFSRASRWFYIHHLWTVQNLGALTKIGESFGIATYTSHSYHASDFLWSQNLGSDCTWRLSDVVWSCTHVKRLGESANSFWHWSYYDVLWCIFVYKDRLLFVCVHIQSWRTFVLHCVKHILCCVFSFPADWPFLGDLLPIFCFESRLAP